MCFAEFADLTWEEFKGGYLGAAQQNCSATRRSEKGGKHNYLRAKGMTLPETVRDRDRERLPRWMYLGKVA